VLLRQLHASWRKLSVVGKEFTFLEISRNVFGGVGLSGSPQCILLAGESIVVCMLVGLGMVCWWVGDACVGVGVSGGVIGVSVLFWVHCARFIWRSIESLGLAVGLCWAVRSHDVRSRCVVVGFWWVLSLLFGLLGLQVSVLVYGLEIWSWLDWVLRVCGIMSCRCPFHSWKSATSKKGGRGVLAGLVFQLPEIICWIPTAVTS